MQSESENPPDLKPRSPTTPTVALSSLSVNSPTGSHTTRLSPLIMNHPSQSTGENPTTINRSPSPKPRLRPKPKINPNLGHLSNNNPSPSSSNTGFVGWNHRVSGPTMKVVNSQLEFPPLSETGAASSLRRQSDSSNIFEPYPSNQDQDPMHQGSDELEYPYLGQETNFRQRFPSQGIEASVIVTRVPVNPFNPFNKRHSADVNQFFSEQNLAQYIDEPSGVIKRGGRSDAPPGIFNTRNQILMKIIVREQKSQIFCNLFRSPEIFILWLNQRFS